MALGFFLGTKYQEGHIGNNALYFDFGKNNKINRILNIIRKNYVDSINVDSMENLAINEILNSLDPHSVYLPPVQAKKQAENLNGNFEGIGIEYYLLADTLLVTSVKPEGPSEKAGLLKGDKIIAVNGESLINKGLLATNTVVEKLRGKKGSQVEVSVLRKGFVAPKKFSITRDNISMSSIEVSYLINPETAFIKLSKFDTKTDDDFTRALESLKKMGMKNLILDLRGNGGGYLSAATSLADHFLADKELIVYTQGLHEPRTDYNATSYGLFEKGRLVILINEETASASEIVAGAIQDLDRGIIIGRPSFGKGLVQEQFPFDDGSAMNLTVARYYTPSGRSIQKSYAKGLKEFEAKPSADTTVLKKTSLHAFKTAKGRIVYDGSGIVPDYLTPFDTSHYSPFYRKLKEKSLISEFIYRFLIEDKMATLYETAEDFSKNYTVKDETLKKLVNFAKARDVNVSEKDLKISAPKLKAEIKAIVARFYFREEGFYRAVNPKDSMVNKALELLGSHADAFR